MLIDDKRIKDHIYDYNQKNFFDENIVKIDPTADKPLGNHLGGFQAIFLKAI